MECCVLIFNDLPPDTDKFVAGPAGSLFALLWLKGTWPRKVAMFIGGWALSFYGAPGVATWLGFSEGFAGFLLGLFGMAIVDKMFEAWDVMDLGTILKDWLRKRLGV